MRKLKDIQFTWKLISTILSVLVVTVSSIYGIVTWANDWVFDEVEAGEVFEQQRAENRHMDYEALAQIAANRIELLEHKISILKKAESLNTEQQINLELWLVDLKAAQEDLKNYRDMQAGVFRETTKLLGESDPNEPE